MRNFVNRFNKDNQSILNLEKGDIVYLRALGGISQAKVVEIQSTLFLTYAFCGLYNRTKMTLLLPNGDTIKFDTESRTKQGLGGDIHIFLSYEDCRRNSHEIGKYHVDDVEEGRNFAVRDMEKYNLVLASVTKFQFCAPTRGGVNNFWAKEVIYNHDDSPLVFNICDRYIGTIDELRDMNIYPTYEEALEAYKPKSITFDSVAKPTTKRVRITRVYETEVPADEVADFILNAHEYEFQDGDECTTFAETI